jgi:hypothetical protein
VIELPHRKTVFMIALWLALVLADLWLGWQEHHDRQELLKMIEAKKP